MTQQAQNRAAPAQTVEEPSEFEKLLQQDFKFKIEYKPFLSDEPITLSPQIVIRYFCKPTKAGAVCSPDQATRFILLCKARKLDPREGDAYIVGYDTKDGPEFNLITAIQALYKRAEAHPEYDGMESGVVVEDDETNALAEIEGDFIPPGCTLVGGWARVHKTGKKFPTKAKINLETFRKPFGVWGTNPQGMICKCAEADALRRAFPNTLGGMYLDGEMPDGTEGQGRVAANKGGAQPSVKVPDKYAAARRIDATENAGSPKGGNAQGTQGAARTAEDPPASSPPDGATAPANASSSTPPEGSVPEAGPSSETTATGTTGEARVEQAGAVDAQAASTPPKPSGRPKAKQERQHEPSMGVKEAEGVPPETIADAFAKETELVTLKNWMMKLGQKVRQSALETAGITTLVDAKEEDVRNAAYNAKLWAINNPT